MGVVLGEVAHPHDAVQRAARLEAVTGAELGHAQRQVAIALQALVEDLDMARAVHRLQGEDPRGGVGDELAQPALVLRDVHVLAELLPMARGFPELAVDQLWGAHLDIAGALQPAAQIALHRAVEPPALGMPEHHPGRLLLLVEEVHLAAEPAVVALLRLLQLQQVGAELLVVRPHRAVDALQLRIAGVAPPIGARQLEQLEGLAELAGRRQMRPGAHVEPAALAIDRDLLVRRDLADPLGLEALALGAEMADRLVAAPDLAVDCLVAVDDLAHARLDHREILRRERLVAGEIVVEAGFGRRPEGDLGAGIELLHCLGQDVRRVVAQQRQRVGMLAGDDLHPGIAVDDGGEIAQRAVDLDGERRLGEARADRGGERAAAQRRVEAALAAVG